MMSNVNDFLANPYYVVAAAVALMAFLVSLLYFDQAWFYVKMIVKSLRRNVLRSTLTSMATMVLVLVVTMVWTVIYFLDLVTQEKSQDFKAIITERWQIPSQMPFAYSDRLAEGAASKQGDAKPLDAMNWTFIGGTTDPANRTRENIVFFFGMDPVKMLRVQRDDRGAMKRDNNGKVIYDTMMDGMDELTDDELDLLDRACVQMKADKRKVVLGREKLKSLNKYVGETFKLSCLNYPGIDLEVQVIGVFPDGRYNQSALMNNDYLLDSMDAWKRKNNKAHPMADKTLNLVWLKVPDSEAFRQVADQIMDSSEFKSPALKAETGSSGVATFLDAYRSILWGMRWLFVPAILATMSLVIANAISISVRERRTEMAVLKVLGFGPNQLLVLILGEAMLIGIVSGFLSATAALVLINYVAGGLKFPIAFFPAFKIPLAALWWGPLLGGITALVGSILPAWSARSVKVAEVFSKIS